MANVRTKPISTLTSGSLVLVEPFRVLDSRVDEPGKYETDAVDGLAVPGIDPYQGVLMNVTITETEGSGFIRVAKEAVVPAPTSTVNWSEDGQTLASMTIVRTGYQAGGVTLQLVGAGRTHVIVDVIGFVV